MCFANMPGACLVPWGPPDLMALRLRSLTRAIEDLGVTQTEEKNRQHSLRTSQALPPFVIRQRHLDYLQLRIARLRRETLRVIACDPELNRRFRLMLTTPGIGETSALQILGELAVLPGALDARQWGAFAGLDPLRSKFWHPGGKETADQPWRQSSSAARFVHAGVGCHTSRAPSASFLSALTGSRKSPTSGGCGSHEKALVCLFRHVSLCHAYDGSKLCRTELASDSRACSGASKKPLTESTPS
jgi:hypothetical protein